MELSTETLIVGAGQAGLALSACLRRTGHDHLLLERGRVAERWRSERWDSFRLLTPNYQTRLPGYRYEGPEPDGFLRRDEIVDFFDRYAVGAPVRTGVTVTRVTRGTPGSRERSSRGSSRGLRGRSRGGWTVHTDRGRVHAANVVVATGHYDRPRIPAIGAALPGDIVQLHTRDYRNPAQLPPGGVLVVGAGPSGQQIAGELARGGRAVYIAAGRHKALPRRYRGRDIYWWLEQIGNLDQTVDSLPSPAAGRDAASVVLAGGEQDLDLRSLAAHGVTVVGRLEEAQGPKLRFAADLQTTLARADAGGRKTRAAVDAHVDEHKLDVPEEAMPVPAVPRWATHPRTRLDLRAAGISTVLWATGFRRDFSWLDAPVLDRSGEPIHRRGVTAAPGLMFLGLRWQHRRKSNSIDGVGADAEYLAEWIAGRGAQTVAAAA